MSSFWDNILKSYETVTDTIVVNGCAVVITSDFWASIGLGVETKPVKQIKPKAVKKTAKKSKAVAQAERVYETIEGLVVPAEDCTHYWIIPSETAWAIGVCKNCSGEKWFSNRWDEQSIFNATLVPPTVQTDSIAEDADIRDITTVYNATQDSIEESE